MEPRPYPDRDEGRHTIKIPLDAPFSVLALSGTVIVFLGGLVASLWLAQNEDHRLTTDASISDLQSEVRGQGKRIDTMEHRDARQDRDISDHEIRLRSHEHSITKHQSNPMAHEQLFREERRRRQ